MKEKIAYKSTKAMFNQLIMVGVLLFIGGYFVIQYQETDQNLMITGFVIIGFAVSIFIANLSAVFSPVLLIEKLDHDIYIHKWMKKEIKVNLSDIIEIKSRLTLRRYLRPLNYTYYSYGTLVLITKDKHIRISNIEDLKDVEKVLLEMMKAKVG